MANYEAKAKVVEEIKAKIQASKSIVLADYNKLTVLEVTDLRRKFKEVKEMRTKKPTLAQKKLMKAHGLDWKTWNVVEEDNLSTTLISKKSGRRRVLRK